MKPLHKIPRLLPCMFAVAAFALPGVAFAHAFPQHSEPAVGATLASAPGTVNPGFVWIGKYQQLGFELTVPINHESGSHVGFMLQYHLYLDDIIPSWSVR
jgi:hypothetical protein